MEELERLLQKHDWHYGRSDDMRVWRSGLQENKEITEIMKSLGNTSEVQELYLKYRPY